MDNRKVLVLVSLMLLVSALVWARGASYSGFGPAGAAGGAGFAPMQRGWVIEAPIQPAWNLATSAISFDGVDDYAAGEGIGCPATGSPRTYVMWVSDGDSGNANPRVALSFYTGWVSNAISCFQIVDQGWGLVFGGNDTYRIATKTVSWTHAAVVFDGGSTTPPAVRAYQNGIHCALRTGADGRTPENGVAYVKLGGVPAIGQLVKAKFAEVAVFDRALATETIQSYYPYRLTGTEPGLVRLYRCDEGTGTTLIDSCGSGYNLTVYNGATPGATWVSRQ